MDVALIRTLRKEYLEILEYRFVISYSTRLLYPFLNLIVGPLSVYVCALNRTFSLVN